MHTVRDMRAACCAPTPWPETWRALVHRTPCRALPTGRAVLRRFFEVIELQVCGQGYLTGGLACAARHEFGQQSTAQLQFLLATWQIRRRLTAPPRTHCTPPISFNHRRRASRRWWCCSGARSARGGAVARRRLCARQVGGPLGSSPQSIRCLAVLLRLCVFVGHKLLTPHHRVESWRWLCTQPVARSPQPSPSQLTTRLSQVDDSLAAHNIHIRHFGGVPLADIVRRGLWGTAWLRGSGSKPSDPATSAGERGRPAYTSRGRVAAAPVHLSAAPCLRLLAMGLQELVMPEKKVYVPPSVFVQLVAAGGCAALRCAVLRSAGRALLSNTPTTTSVHGGAKEPVELLCDPPMLRCMPPPTRPCPQAWRPLWASSGRCSRLRGATGRCGAPLSCCWPPAPRRSTSRWVGGWGGERLACGWGRAAGGWLVWGWGRAAGGGRVCDRGREAGGGRIC